MRSRAIFASAISLAVGAGSCAVLAPFDDHPTAPGTDGGDAASALDAAPNDAQADAGGLQVSVSPTLVTLDPGAPPATVRIDVTPSAASSAAVTLSLAGAAPGVTASTPAPLAGGRSTSFTFTVDAASAARGDTDFVVTATQDVFTMTARARLRVTGVLTPGDAGVLDVPVREPATILVKAWGGGGGAALQPGGGGGFVSARFDVTPPTQLHLVVGTGGGAGVAWNGGAGGGTGGSGGGFSGVDVDGVHWLIAGGGGGGGSDVDEPGGGGGGVQGQDSIRSGTSCYGGGGGTAIAGGAVHKCSAGDDSAQPGDALAGGAGGLTQPSGPAGLPGGGIGGGSTDANLCGGGGGGGGWFGGAGGSENGNSGGGGGGSGYVISTGTRTSLIPANSASAANSADPDYGAGTPGRGGASAWQPGLDGRVVVRLIAP